MIGLEGTRQDRIGRGKEGKEESGLREREGKGNRKRPHKTGHNKTELHKTGQDATGQD